MVLVIHDLFANARKGASKHKNVTLERYRESRVEKPLQRYSVTKLQGFTNPDITGKFALEQVYRIAEKNARTHRSSVNNGVCIKYVSSSYRKPTGLVNSLPFFCNLTILLRIVRIHPKSAITLRSAGKKRHSSDDGIEQIRRPSLRYLIPAGRENRRISVTLHFTLKNRKNGGRKRSTGREFYQRDSGSQMPLAGMGLRHFISLYFGIN
ncbi:hypothetical protein ALC57_00426 [Trachymyrmex cornetzi]|uniref:Uncharacterized protein n=1 Tax=Trachymyrmex cornetzi TaxID=471704 RepID=A0A151JS30_9HYME|nr:hypothetical protein ALC57_00426 [Trachymyrmex cornetzi]